MEDETSFPIDFDFDGWALCEHKAYRLVVGVTARYAAAKIGYIIDEADENETVDTSELDDAGERIKVPTALFNLPQEYILGFIWVRSRRDRPLFLFNVANRDSFLEPARHDFEEFAKTVPYEDVLGSLFDELSKFAPDEEKEPDPPVAAPAAALSPDSPTMSCPTMPASSESACSTAGPGSAACAFPSDDSRPPMESPERLLPTTCEP